MAKRKGFGVLVSFKGDKTTLEELFGSKPILSTQMAKVLWNRIRERQFEEQKDWNPKVGESAKAKFTNGKWFRTTIKKVNGKKFTVTDGDDTWTVSRRELLMVAK